MLPAKRTLFLLCGAFLGAIWIGIAQDQDATEALTGFHTPSFNSAESVSNGLPEPKGDTFALDQDLFERNHQEISADPTQTGLGPVYNATACASCHENPNSGGQSQITEIRVGHNDASGNFVNPTIYINDGKDMISGRSIVNDRATVPEAQERVPDTENIRSLRAALNTLGDGFVEAIDDQTLIDIANRQVRETHGRVHGQALKVSMFEAAQGETRVGRFGWKDQHGSLLSFAADAYLNEIGVTSRLRRQDVTNVGKKTNDPEDVPDANGMADIDHFAQFIRATMAPPRDEATKDSPAAMHGEHVFAEIGCRTCHVDTIVTAKAGTPVGGTYVVPDALANKVIHPFGDFLLHDVGTGDGIVQTMGHQETANEMRTAPLWGLRTHSRFMHDLKSLSLENAIARHKGEADEASDKFRELSQEDRQDLLAFLNSL